MPNSNIKTEKARNNYNFGKKMSKHGATKRHSDNYPNKNKNLLRDFLNGKTTISKDDYSQMLEIINTNGKNSKDEYTPLGKAAYNKLQAMMNENNQTIQPQQDVSTSEQNLDNLSEVRNESHATPTTISAPENNQDLYQALVNGINNEEIKNPYKGYSNDDLKTILAHHDRLLENSNGNGINFESLYENSNSDLKKFASGALVIDTDSYETMQEFIKTFGTDSKGHLTPEGKAAYDKLMALITDAKNLQKTQNKTQHLSEDKEKDDKPTFNDKPFTPIIIIDDNNHQAQQNGNENNNPQDKQSDKGVVVIPPIVNAPSQKDRDFVPPAENKKAKKDNWFKRNWKKLAAGAAFVAATLFGLSQCKSCTDDKNNKKEDKKEVVTPTPEPTPTPKPQPKPEITLTPEDTNNGFFLERSAGFKGEQSSAGFAAAEKANKEDMLNLKKLLTKGELNLEAFKRHEGSKLKEDISIVEIAYKLRIVTQNFPNSAVAKDINSTLKGNVKNIDKDNIYTAFNRVDDYGNVLNKKGKKVKTIAGTKQIDQERRGQGSEEYGTKGTFDNFIQVLNNHRNNLNK